MASRRTRPDPHAPPASELESARAAAIALLARRDFASGELRARLTARGCDPAVAAAVTVELIESHTLDDARFATNYVAYHANRGQGPVRIAAQLRNLGIAAELIEEALASGPQWRALAAHERVHKFGSARPQSWAEKARQARFLQYRGFSADDIRSILDTDIDLQT
jgi:regulatory protein